MTAEETAPFLIFYENHIRLLFHNFKDLNNINNHTSKHWDSYVELNQKFAKEILAVRAKLKNVPK
jgi:trehalose-6-phosphate synthase